MKAEVHPITYLEAVRREMGLTQKELAEKVGTSHTIISELERAAKDPSKLRWDWVDRIEEITGLKVAEMCKPIRPIRELDGDPS